MLMYKCDRCGEFCDADSAFRIEHPVMSDYDDYGNHPYRTSDLCHTCACELNMFLDNILFVTTHHIQSDGVLKSPDD